MKKKNSALKFTDTELEGTALKEHVKGESKPPAEAPDPEKKAHRRKKHAAVNEAKKGKKAKQANKARQADAASASRFCNRSPALGGKDSLGCSADKALRAQLRFEEDRVKKPSKLNHAVKALPTDTAISAVRRNIQADSEDNSEVQAADTALGAVQTEGRLSNDSRRSKEFREERNSEYSQKSERNSSYSSADTGSEAPQASSQTSSQSQKAKPKGETLPDGTPSPAHSRQKASIKKDYAKKAKENAESASEAASKAAEKAKEVWNKFVDFVNDHKGTLLIIGIIAILVILLLGVMSSCSMMLQSGASGLGMTTYPSRDEDMLSAEETYKALEDNLNHQIADYELTHFYNEYVYSLDPTGHDPYVLTSALTAIYGKEWTASDVSELILSFFTAQCTLTENVVTETRYYTDYVTEWQWVWDNYWGQWVQIPVTVEVQVPYDYYICYVTLEVKDLEEVVTSMMTEDQKIAYDVYMELKGNRPDLFE